MSQGRETPPPGPVKTFARIASVILHPGFMPFYFLIPYSANKSQQLYILLGSALLLVLLPVGATVIYLKKSGVKDLYTVDRKKRFWPFTFHAIGIAIFGYVMEAWLQGYMPLRWIVFVFLFNLLGFAVTLFWKISLHMMGIVSVLGFCLAAGTEMVPIWLTVTVAGLSILTAWARMYLRSHDIYQILAGTAVGFSAMYFGWIYWLS